MSFRRIALGWAAAGFVGTLAYASADSFAQGIASHNSRAPVSYEAGRIELFDRENRVVLSGDVRITQAGLRLNAARTLVTYDDAGGTIRIQRIVATGSVDVRRGNERARGDSAIYDFNRRIITMAGNVRLNRGGDTLNGGRLVIDLNTGVSSIDGQGAAPTSGASSTTSGGRVTGTFAVPQ